MFFKAMNINQLKGRIVGDPEFKETKTGKKLLTFSLMYFTKQTTDSEGSHNNFIPVEAWQTTAEIVAPLLSKGLEVIVNGTIIQKRWIDDNGSMKSQFVFSADAINITDLKFSINEDIQTEAA